MIGRILANYADKKEAEVQRIAVTHQDNRMLIWLGVGLVVVVVIFFLRKA